MAASIHADVLYQWTIYDGGNSISYSFSVPTLPAGTVITSNSPVIDGFAPGFSNHACAQRSAEDCVAEIEFTSAPSGINDLDFDFGQAAIWLCWDAGAFGCNTGYDVVTGATFPTLDIGQYGVYQGVTVGSGLPTTLTIVDPPSDVPEPGTGTTLIIAGASLLLCGIFGRFPCRQ